jgi:hypothetical protein
MLIFGGCRLSQRIGRAIEYELGDHGWARSAVVLADRRVELVTS